MNQSMIEDVIDALAEKNRTVKGWEGKVSLCDLGYCAAGIDEGWEGCGLGANSTQHYLNGTPATNPKLFPDMRGLVEYGHKKNVKMGWYFNGCAQSIHASIIPDYHIAGAVGAQHIAKFMASAITTGLLLAARVVALSGCMWGCRWLH
jgi:hypothetical protein